MIDRFGRSLRHEDEAIYSVTDLNYAKLSRIMTEKITFEDRDCVGMDYPHTDALVITTMIGQVKVHQTLVDNGSFVSLLYKYAFDQMELS